MLEINHELSIRKQADLLGISRSGFYYKPIMSNDSEVANLIREVYLASDCRYGYRKVSAMLKINGQPVNSKKVLRIMKEMNIEGLYPKKFIATSQKDDVHKAYPYLLSNLKITYPNHVWATDITYIKLGEIFMYFIAIIDVYSRYIVAYDLSHSLEIDSSIMTLKNALAKAIPEIFNTDQGVQFTSNEFIDELIKFNIKISMDHKGRCFDNIFIERLWRTLKQEAIYYYRPETIKDLESCLSNFVVWYNNERLHQSLNYRTPCSVYFN